MTAYLGLSKALHALGHRVKITPSAPASKRITLSVNDFDLVWRAVTQLGRYFLAHTKVEEGVIDFDLQHKVVKELEDAREAIDADVLDLIGWKLNEKE